MVSTILNESKVNYALLDLTLNKGNSGGAIIVKSSAGPNVVVGLAKFVYNPLQKSDSLAEELSKRKGIVGFGVQTDQNGNRISGVDPVEIDFIIAKAIQSSSIGVSGCVSIEYIKAAQETLNSIK